MLCMQTGAITCRSSAHGSCTWLSFSAATSAAAAAAAAPAPSLSFSSASVGMLERRACSVWNARDCGQSMRRLYMARMRSGYRSGDSSCSRTRVNTGESISITNLHAPTPSTYDYAGTLADP